MIYAVLGLKRALGIANNADEPIDYLCNNAA